MNKPKIIFFGTPEFSETILDSLIKAGHDIAGVFTRPDQKVGRRQEWKKTPVKILAEKKNIPVFTPGKLDETAIAKVRNLLPSIIITAAYGKIIPQSILDIPKFGALNVHPSLLPKFRGPSPIQNALLSGEKETGTTIMLMNAGIDTGDILKQENFSIDPADKLPELSQKLASLSAKLLLETIPLQIEEKIEPQKQNNDEASLCRIIKKGDGRIDWRESAESIYNRYRAFYPWPGIFTIWNGKRIKLNKVSLAENNQEKNHPTGKVFMHNTKIAIQAKEGAIILEELQLEGKPSIKTVDFVNGYKNFIGSIL